MNLAQLEELLDLLKRIQCESVENKNDRGEHVALLSWALETRLEEEIAQLEQLVDAMQAGV